MDYAPTKQEDGIINAGYAVWRECIAEIIAIELDDNCKIVPLTQKADAVSYTHLDVYKRQVNRRPVNFSGHKNNLRFLFGVIHQIRKTKASASCMRKTR